jgi:hypothetical protein
MPPLTAASPPDRPGTDRHAHRTGSRSECRIQSERNFRLVVTVLHELQTEQRRDGVYAASKVRVLER